MKIVEATAADTQRLGEILASVFEDHPFYQYVTQDQAKRDRMVGWMTNRIVAYGLAYGTVFTDENRNGVSVIMPTAEGGVAISRMVRVGLIKAPLKFGPIGFWKFLRFSGRIEKVRKSLMKNDHLLQLTVGVDPGDQGSGLGSALLQAGTALADREGLDSYAETVLENVVGWYDKYGYKVIAENEVPHIGTLYSMVRKFNPDKAAGPGRPVPGDVG